MIQRLLRYIVLPFIFLLAIGSALVSTETGTRWVIHSIPAKYLSVKTVSGKLSDTLKLANIYYHDGQQDILIDQLLVDWSPGKLLNGKLQINKILAQNVTVVTKKAHLEQEQQNNNIKLPFAVIVDKLQVQHAQFKTVDQSNIIELAAIELQGALTNKQLAVAGNWQELNYYQHQQLLLHNHNTLFDINGMPDHYRVKANLSFYPLKLNSVLYNQVPINANLDVLIENKNIMINSATLLAADSKIAIKGKITQYYELLWDIHSNNLNELLPTAKGSINLKGNLTGTRQLPSLKTTITASNLSYERYKIKAITGAIDATLAPQGKLAITINASDIDTNNYFLKKLFFASEGNTNNHAIKLDISSPKGTVSATANGKLDYQQNQWRGTINHLKLVLERLGTWQLHQPATTVIAPDKFVFRQLSLQQAQQLITLNTEWAVNGDSYIDARIIHLDLNKLAAIFPDKISINSSLDAQLQLIKKFQQPAVGQVKINLTRGNIKYSDAGQQHYFNFDSGKFIADLAPAKLVVDANLIGYKGQKIIAQINLPDFPQPSAKQNLDGRIIINIADIGIFSGLFPNLENIRGKINANIILAGTLKKLFAQGNLNLTQGEADIHALGINLKNVNLLLNGSSNGIFNVKGQAFSRKGILYVNGQARLINNNIDGNFILTGTNMLIANIPDYKIYASPNVQLKIHNDNLYLTGNIYIPKAKIRPQWYSEDSIEVSSDIQYVNNNGEKIDNTPLKLYSKINLTLGDFVTVNYSGLTGQLTGNLQITDSPTSTATGVGNLALVGNYKAYGQTLTIQQGRLIFSGGDIANPSLDIQAVKTVNLVSASTGSGITNLNNAAALVAQGNQVTVGIHVQGTVNNRQIALFSQPPILNQTDILSYLILGRPAAQATQADAQLLYNAATALDFGGNQVSNISEQVKNTLGLDEVNIGTMSSAGPQTNNTAADNTSLIIGKALSPKLYLNYSIGLIQPVNTLRLRYFFSPSWILQSETNSLANALDIFYTFDR